MGESYKDQTFTKHTSLGGWGGRHTTRRGRSPAVCFTCGLLPRPFTSSAAHGTLIFHWGIYLSAVPECWAKSRLQRWARLGRSQSRAPGYRDASQLGACSHVGITSKTQGLSKENRKTPFWMGAGLRKHVTNEGDSGGKAHPGDWVAGPPPHSLRELIDKSFWSWVPRILAAISVWFFGTCKCRVLSYKLTIPPPRENHRHFGFNSFHTF